jgi:hypothetical protein
MLPSHRLTFSRERVLTYLTSMIPIVHTVTGPSKPAVSMFSSKTEVRLQKAAKRAKPEGVATRVGVIFSQSVSEPKAFRSATLAAFCQFYFGVLSAGVQEEISARVQKETFSKRVISEDFRPGILGWERRLGHGPELA